MQKIEKGGGGPLVWSDSLNVQNRIQDNLWISIGLIEFLLPEKVHPLYIKFIFFTIEVLRNLFKNFTIGILVVLLYQNRVNHSLQLLKTKWPICVISNFVVPK